MDDGDSDFDGDSDGSGVRLVGQRTKGCRLDKMNREEPDMQKLAARFDLWHQFCVDVEDCTRLAWEGQEARVRKPPEQQAQSQPQSEKAAGGEHGHAQIPTAAEMPLTFRVQPCGYVPPAIMARYRGLV